MEKTEFKVKKEDLLRYIEGHKKAEEIIQAEKRKHLPQLTPEESLKMYDELCNLWEEWKSILSKEDLERLEQERIAFKVELRRRFNKVGGRK